MQKILIGREYLPEALSLVQQAKKTIYIIIFDWRIYYTPHNQREQNLILEIQKAKARGVDVKVVANNDYVIKELTSLGIAAKATKFYKIVHAKMLLVDDSIAVLGSHNFTASSFERNLEISTVFDDPDCVKVLTGNFLTLWN